MPRVTVVLTLSEAEEVWAALDSHAQDLQNNASPANSKARAACGRAIDKFTQAIAKAGV